MILRLSIKTGATSNRAMAEHVNRKNVSMDATKGCQLTCR